MIGHAENGVHPIPKISSVCVYLGSGHVLHTWDKMNLNLYPFSEYTEWTFAIRKLKAYSHVMLMSNVFPSMRNVTSTFV